MGGSSNHSTSIRRTAPTGGGGAGEDCPQKLRTVITGPAAGIAAGTWLEVKLDKSSTPPRVVLLDLTAGTIVGSITGVPSLDLLIDCLEKGVDYRAYTDLVAGGRIDVTIVRQ